MIRVQFIHALIAVLAFAAAARVWAGDRPLVVVTSIPDFADIAHEIGGAHITVESLAKGTEDPHGVPVRPSLAVRLAHADALIEMGLEMEHAWLPALVDAANNPKIKAGHEGDIVASEGIVPLDVPIVVSRTEGEQHPEGNPHFNVGPASGRIFATNICSGLSRLAPEYKEDFSKNLKRYVDMLSKKESEWHAAGVKLKGIKFVSYHPDMAYLADYFSMEQAGTLEPKPGIPPSASHTASLIQTMKSQGVKLILREPQYSDRLANEVAAQTGAKVVKIAIMVNGVSEAKTWIAMIDTNIKALLEALK